MADKSSMGIKRISSKSSGDEILEFFEYRFDPVGFKTIGESDLPLERKWYFWALGQHYRETGNIYFALEAFNEMVVDLIAPPAWVLEALSEGVRKHMKNPDPGMLTNQLGVCKHKFNSFERRKNLAKVMPDFAKLVGPDFNLNDTNAGRVINLNYGTDWKPKKLAEIYHKEFEPFYKRLNMVPVSLSNGDRQRFVESLKVKARKLITKVP